MAVFDDLTAEVKKILSEPWEVHDGVVVPETADLKLSNHARKLVGTVLYADLADSTGLVLTNTPEFAATLYKCYLVCACRIIKERNGVITAFDGDRVMAVFLGSSKDSDAVRAALAINHAVGRVLNPAIQARDPLKRVARVKQAVGIDTSQLFVARTGIRGANDLVWVGRAANIAAKLSAFRHGTSATFITDDVYKGIDKGLQRSSVWEDHPEACRNLVIRRSSTLLAL